MSDLKLNKYTSNFHPLEVVGRGSDPQLQAGENLNWETQQATGQNFPKLQPVRTQHTPLTDAEASPKLGSLQPGPVDRQEGGAWQWR